jgi:hypothetical protein
VKSGFVAHSLKTLSAVLSGDYGDSHGNAIRALDLAVFHIIRDLFGLQALRSDVRAETSWSEAATDVNTKMLAAIADKPLGVIVDYPKGSDGVTPVSAAYAVYIGQQATNGYVSVLDAIHLLSQRSAGPTGTNLVKNSTFALGSTSPLGWTGTGTLAADPSLSTNRTWTIVDTTVSQDLLATTESLRDRLSGVDVFSVAVRVKTAGGGTVRVGLRAADAVGDPAYDQFWTSYVDTGGVEKLVSFAIKPAWNVSRKALTLQIQAVGTAAIHGAWVGVGMPCVSPDLDMSFHEFVSRDGGSTVPMRGDLYMGTNKIKDVGDAAAAKDALNRDSGDTRYIHAYEATVPVGGKRITGVAAGIDATDAAVVDQVVLKTGSTMSGFLTLHADPDSTMKAATKGYADTVSAGARERYYKTLTTAQSVTMPALPTGYSVWSVTLRMVAGGGGGADGSSSGAGGGGGGAYYEDTFNLAVGDVITAVSVGAGGDGGASDNAPGEPGTPTEVSVYYPGSNRYLYIKCGPGEGGTATTGGLGGSVVFGYKTAEGGATLFGNPTTVGVPGEPGRPEGQGGSGNGGTGGSSACAAGGQGADDSALTNATSGYLGSGGGGGSAASGHQNGFDGGVGFVEVSYIALRTAP